jgi:hypothetical protein
MSRSPRDNHLRLLQHGQMLAMPWRWQVRRDSSTMHANQMSCFQEEAPIVCQLRLVISPRRIPGDECYVELTVLMDRASPSRGSHPNLRSSPLYLSGRRPSRSG